MEKGLTACHQIIRDHCDDRRVVQIVISALTDKNLLINPKDDKNHTAISLHAAIFGFLAECFGQNMVNPADKNRRKTYQRIYNFMEKNFLTKGHDTISNGCSIAML
jgi:hypothetical protein